MESLKGKTAIITGAGSGIGRACAVELAKAGVNVVSVDVNVEANQRCLADIHAAGGNGITVCCDALSERGAHHMALAAAKAFDHVDVLVCAAGLMLIRSAEAALAAEWAAAFAANATGCALAARYTAAHMRRHGGSIVLVGSISGIRPDPGFATYSASKAALLMLTRSLASEYGEFGIRVNQVTPGPVDTPGLRATVQGYGADWNHWRERIARMQCIERMVQPEDVAQAVLFLASDQSAMITGTSLIVDGGLLSRSAVM